MAKGIRMAPDKEDNFKRRCAEHSGFVARVGKLETENTEQWVAINHIRNRPPVWATATISLLTFMLGASLTYAALVVKVAAVARAAAP